MVALTAMLVMYTLFQSISGDMPNTAYLKILDYWLMFGLLMPFVIFITVVFWEITKTKAHVSTMNGVTEERISARPIKKFLQILIPTLSMSFVVIYTLIISIYIF